MKTFTPLFICFFFLCHLFASAKSEQTAPLILFLNPIYQYQQTTASEVSIEAKVYGIERPDDLKFHLNGAPIEHFQFDKSTNTFLSTISLQQGLNQITLEGYNPWGIDQAKLNIEKITQYYAPEIEWIEPAINQIETKYATVPVTLGVQHCDRPSEIALFLNDSPINDFHFNPNNAQLSVQLALTPGFNQFIVRARNAFGESQKTLRINRLIPPPAQIRWLAPDRLHSRTTQAQIDLKALVGPIATNDNVRLFVNNQERFDFYFTPSTGQLEKSILLVPGTNKIELQLITAYGIIQREVLIDRLIPPPALPPAVQFQGVLDGHHYREASLEVYARVIGINHRNDLLFFVNGGRQNNFRFQSSQEKFVSTIRLTPGQNTVHLIANSAMGVSQKLIHVYYDPPILPVVQLLPPTPDEVSYERRIIFRAKVLHIDHCDHLQLNVNGRPSRQLTYNPNRQVARAEIRLEPGYNEIQLIANNEDGQTIVAHQIKYIRKLPTGQNNKKKQLRGSSKKHNNLLSLERS